MSDILEFGIKRENEERRDGGCAVVFDPVSQKYAVNRMIDHNRFGFFSGGVEDGESMEEGILREVIEESGLYNFLYIEKIAEALCHSIELGYDTTSQKCSIIKTCHQNNYLKKK